MIHSKTRLSVYQLTIAVILFAAYLWAPPVLAKNTKPAAGHLLDHNGNQFFASSLNGKKVIGTVVYTTCPSICLFTIENLKKIEATLKNSSDYTFLLVTADPRGDTPDKMRAYLKTHKVDKPNWIFVGGEATSVTQFANKILDMGFSRKTGINHVMHSIKIAFIDRNGKIAHTIQGVTPPIGELIAAIEKNPS